jgi:transposase
MTPRRYELTDFEWSIIAPQLPNAARRRAPMIGGC